LVFPASGGTLFAHLLAQTGGSVGILDLWASKAVPAAADLGVSPSADVVVKVASFSIGPSSSTE